MSYLQHKRKAKRLMLEANIAAIRLKSRNKHLANELSECKIKELHEKLMDLDYLAKENCELNLKICELRGQNASLTQKLRDLEAQIKSSPQKNSILSKPVTENSPLKISDKTQKILEFRKKQKKRVSFMPDMIAEERTLEQKTLAQYDFNFEEVEEQTLVLPEDKTNPLNSAMLSFSNNSLTDNMETGSSQDEAAVQNFDVENIHFLPETGDMKILQSEYDDLNISKEKAVPPPVESESEDEMVVRRESLHPSLLNKNRPTLTESDTNESSSKDCEKSNFMPLTPETEVPSSVTRRKKKKSRRSEKSPMKIARLNFTADMENTAVDTQLFNLTERQECEMSLEEETSSKEKAIEELESAKSLEEESSSKEKALDENKENQIISPRTQELLKNIQSEGVNLEQPRRARRDRKQISYAEPSLNTKMRSNEVKQKKKPGKKPLKPKGKSSKSSSVSGSAPEPVLIKQQYKDFSFKQEHEI